MEQQRNTTISSTKDLHLLWQEQRHIKLGLLTEMQGRVPEDLPQVGVEVEPVSDLEVRVGLILLIGRGDKK